MTYCSNCGKNNIEGAKFCGKCGTKIQDVKNLTTPSNLQSNRNTYTENNGYLKKMFSDRINVGDYWIGIVSSLTLFVFFMTIGEWATQYSGVFIVIAVIIWWIYNISFHIKRAHDLNYSAWILLLFFVPLVNIYYGLRLAFSSGETEANEYGNFITKDKNFWERLRRIYSI